MKHTERGLTSELRSLIGQEGCEAVDLPDILRHVLRTLGDAFGWETSRASNMFVIFDDLFRCLLTSVHLI